MPGNSTQASRDGLKTRVSLLQRAKDDPSQLAWAELLGYYEPFVSKILGGMGFRGPDLDDARQQVFVRLWKGLQSYDRNPEQARFRTWFSRLIRNTASNIFRAKRRQLDGPSMDDGNFNELSTLSEDPAIDAQVEREWEEYVVGLALERARSVFSGNAVKVFTMSLAGDSVEDIAEQLGIKPATVYVLRHRVKTVLLEEIRQLTNDLENFGDIPIS
ncbi:RNA polymerase sigma factor [Haloferula sp.]|uniref:RNA polymerase sigma factor n=1 Tax=Haloferula sp. TaxID=2497595 RepID=UPI00329D10B9